jgi:hypothetical protein
MTSSQKGKNWPIEFLYNVRCSAGLISKLNTVHVVFGIMGGSDYFF